ncbi:MAG: hypothetical protein HOM22_02685, partial [Candidatus Marinimicrobia bacterium]|nr:hypothetical protein [Candidatus Neomarinimicrobiota bacterium]
MKFVSNIISNKYLKQTRELYGDDLYLDFGSKLDNKISNDNHFDNNYKLNLELFNKQINDCQKCSLGSSRSNFVFGVGDANA